MSRLGGWLLLVGALFFGPALTGRGDAPPGEVKPPAPPARALDSHGDPLPRGARARIGTVRFRHGGPIQSLRCLPDGKVLLSYGNDSTLRFWEADTGKEIRHVRPNFDAVNNRMNNNRQLFANGLIFPGNGLDGLATPCLSTDGKILVDPESNNLLKVRDLFAGTVVRELKLDKGNLRHLALSPDDKIVAAAVFEQDPNTGVQNGRIRLWEIATGKELPEMIGPAPKEGQMRFVPQYFIFAPNGKAIAAVGQEFQGRNGIIRVWQMGKEKEPIRLSEHLGSTGPLAFSPDGRLLAEISANPVTGGNARLRLWDTFTGKEIQELGECPNGATAVVFSPDGKFVAHLDATQSVHLWDTSTGKEVVGLNGVGAVNSVVFAPDSKTFAVCGNDQTLRLHETSSGKELHQWKGFLANLAPLPFGASIQGLGAACSFSPDGKIIYATGGILIRRWDTATGKEIALKADGPESSMSDLIFSADGKELLTVGEGGLRVWDPVTLRRLRAPEGPMTDEGDPLNAACLALSPDGKTVAIGWIDGRITLSETATGKELRRLEGGHANCIFSLVFSGNGKALLSSCYEGRVLWWDVASGKQVSYLAGKPRPAEEGQVPDGMPPPPPSPVRLAMMPDGGTVAGAGIDDNLFKVRFWELATGKLRRTLVVDNLAGDLKDRARLELEDNDTPNGVGNGYSHLSIAPDGKNLALGVGPNIELRELRRGREVRQFALNGQLSGLKFSPNGKYLAAGSDDGSIRLWDVANGTVLAEMRGHRGGINAVAFAPDGKSLASIGADSNILIWEIALCLETDFPPPRLTDKEVNALWQDLAGDDAEKGYRAVQRLAEASEQALPLLRDRLRPVPLVDKDHLAQLVADLEHTRFDQRKRAAAELEKLAEQAEPALTQRLKNNPSLDLKQQLEKLLERQAGPAVVTEQVRALRAVEALRDIAAPESRELLEKMAKGAPESRVTQAARTALERMPRRE